MLNLQSPAASLFDWLLGPLRWQLLSLGLRKRLFDDLVEPLTPGQLASQHGFDSEQCRRLLDAYSSCQLLLKQQQRYRLNPPLNDFLCSTGRQWLGPTLLHLAALKHSSDEQLEQLLQQPLAQPSVFHDKAFWDRSVAQLRCFHRALWTHQALELLRKLPEWQRATSLLDLGAGSEQLCVQLSQLRPDLALSVFDLPPSAKRIEAVLEQEIGKPIKVYAGDYNSDALPGQQDIIWASMCLYYANPLEELAAKIYHSLSPRGVFIALHEGLSEQRSYPEAHVLGRLLPALRGADVSFEQGQLVAVLQQVGFRDIQSQTFDTPIGPLEAVVARR